MKKYLIAAAAFVLVAGAASAQVTPKKAEAPTTKTTKPAAKKPTASTATVAPATASDASKTGTAAVAPKKKHTKKHKSVTPASK